MYGKKGKTFSGKEFFPFFLYRIPVPGKLSEELQLRNSVSETGFFP